MLVEKPWPPDRVMILLVRLFTCMFGGIILISLLSATGWLSAAQVRFVTSLIGTMSFHGVALVLVHIFLLEQKISWKEAFGFLQPQMGRALLLALLVSTATTPIAWTLGELSAMLLKALGGKPAVQDPVLLLQASGSLPMRIWLGFLVVIVAPFAEELIFRGILYPTLKRCSLPRIALWGTSFLFAAIHHNFMVFLPLTFLAVVWTLLYEATGNLLAPFLAHSIFNFVNFCMLTNSSNQASLGIP